MKKIYFKPIVESIEIDESLSLLSGSFKITTYSGSKNGDIETGSGMEYNGSVQTTDGMDAKGNNHWGLSLDSDW